MSGSNFEALIQEILKQKQIMDQLAEENNELRRQLAALRDGHGIFIDIHGQRFALIGSNPLANKNNAAPASFPLTEQKEPMTQEEPSAIEAQPTMQMAFTGSAEAPTQAMPELDEFAHVQPALAQDETDDFEGVFTVDKVANGHLTGMSDMAEMPTHPDVTPLPSSHLADEEELPATFLDDMAVDELVATASNSKAVWTPPQVTPQRKQTKKLVVDDEETKAVLRRELIGSFLLE